MVLIGLIITVVMVMALLVLGVELPPTAIPGPNLHRPRPWGAPA